MPITLTFRPCSAGRPRALRWLKTEGASTPSFGQPGIPGSDRFQTKGIDRVHRGSPAQVLKWLVSTT